MSNRLDSTFAALADPTRRQVVDLLRRSPRRAGELAARTNMSPPAMSRHLRVLRSSGIVEVESAADDARARVYKLRQKPFGDLEAWLDEVQAFWDDQLASFKTHAEREPR
jgi:DNA-binding transcriptional ArsR family regulator